MDGAAQALRGAAISIFEPSQARLERLGEWFEAEYEPLLRFAYFLCGDRAAAEDLVQDAFVRIYRAGARVEEHGFPAYARRTLVNLRRSAWRRGQIERRALATAGPSDRAVPDADPVVRDEVWGAILSLSRRQRACIALRYYEDLSEQHVAEVLGMSTGAVKKHTSRAMERLRASLADRREP